RSHFSRRPWATCRVRVPLPLGALLSKLPDAFRCRSRSDAVFIGFSIWKPVPEMSLSLWEGGAKRRVRAGNAPSSGPSGHLLPEGEGHEPRFRLIWTPVMQARREAQAR